MIFETIHDILNGSLQPWRKDNALSESIYHERLMNISADEMPAELKYIIRYRPEIMFTNRIRYYCRIVHHEIVSHLLNMYSTLSDDDCSDLTCYHLKVTREAITTLVHDAVGRSQQYPVDISSLTQANADFLTQRAEKEYTVILRYIVASLCHCGMEIQQRYKNAVNPIDLYDVPTFYASVAGWSTDPLFLVEPIVTNNQMSKSSHEAKQNRKTPKKRNLDTFTKATFTLNSIQEDARITEQRMSVFCDSLFSDFVKAEDENRAKERRKIEKLLTGKLLNENEIIVWKATKKELVYFFRQLKPYLTYPSKENFWSIVASHFVIETQGKRKIRPVPISADSLKNTTGKLQPDIIRKLDDLIKLLTAPIDEVLRQHSADMEEEESARYQQMAEKDYTRELNPPKQKR